jgi:integrase/recombinase XerD
MIRHNSTQKVAKKNKRIYAFELAKLWLGKKPKMSKQAKTLTPQDLRRVLDYVATRPHAARNRAMLLLMYYAGLRVGEAASLRVADVVDAAGQVLAEFHLRAEQTKGRHARTVFVSERLRKELAAYLSATPSLQPKHKLFYSQKANSDGFTANTLTQHFHYLYKRAGIIGASSHSTRRTFITNLAAQGISVRVLASLAGHRSIATTQRYIDVNDEQKRRAVELI